jgi:hypothetical protein
MHFAGTFRHSKGSTNSSVLVCGVRKVAEVVCQGCFNRVAQFQDFTRVIRIDVAAR